MADNGEIAIDKLKANSFDVILMDLHMPIMDGFEATKLLKSEPDLCDIPIIGLSADADESTKNDCLAIGMSEFVVKPFEPSELTEKIKNALK